MRSRHSRRQRRRARAPQVTARHLEQARGILGALILDPPMIPAMARLHPPAWFRDEGCLAVMRAIFCVQRWPDLGVEDVIEALESHGDLDRAGGPGAVRDLVQPGPRLDAGKNELTIARANMAPVVDDPLVQFSVGLLDAWPEDPAAPD